MQAQSITDWAGSNASCHPAKRPKPWQNPPAAPPPKFPRVYCWPSSSERYTNERQGTLYRSVADWLGSPEVLGKVASRKLIETVARGLDQLLYRTHREANSVFKDGQDQLARDLGVSRKHAGTIRKLLRVANVLKAETKRGIESLDVGRIPLSAIPSQWREWMAVSPWMALQRRDNKSPQVEENTSNGNSVPEPLLYVLSNFLRKRSSGRLLGIGTVLPEKPFTKGPESDPDPPDSEYPWPEVLRPPSRVLNLKTPAERKAEEIAILQAKYGPIPLELREGELIPPNHPELLRYSENLRLDFATAKDSAGGGTMPPPPPAGELGAMLAQAKSVPWARAMPRPKLEYDSTADWPQHLRPDRGSGCKFKPNGRIDWSQF